MFANDLKMTAVGGIDDGAHGAMAIDASQVSASNSGSGNIVLSHSGTGNLSVANLGLGYGIQNAAASGGVTVKATQSNLAIDSAIAAGSGGISLVADAGAVSITGTSVTTTGGPISISGTVTALGADAILVQGAVIDSTVGGGAGNIDINGHSNSGRGVSLSDGFPVPTQVRGGTISIVGTSGSAQGVQILNSDVSSSVTSGPAVFVSGTGPSTAVDLFSGSVSSPGGEIKLVGDSINIGGAVNSGIGRTIFTPNTATRPITLGGTDEATKLNLTNAELSHVASSVVVVGSATTLGGIEVLGPVGLNPGQSLSLLNQGTISGTDPISVERLNVESANGVFLTAANNVGTLSGKFGVSGFIFSNAGPLTIGTVDATNGVTGTSAAGGTVSINAAGQLNVAHDVLVAGPAGNVSLLRRGRDARRVDQSRSAWPAP